MDDDTQIYIPRSAKPAVQNTECDNCEQNELLTIWTPSQKK